METEKRMYSLNCVAYTIAVTNLLPRAHKDEESGTYYFTFPQCDGLEKAVRAYRMDNPNVPIQDFLRAMKLVRAYIKRANAENLDESDII